MKMKMKIRDTEGELITETEVGNDDSGNDFIKKVTITFKSLNSPLLYKKIHEDRFFYEIDKLAEREFDKTRRSDQTWSGQEIVQQKVFKEEIIFKKVYCLGNC
jgi:hypothetical protein